MGYIYTIQHKERYMTNPDKTLIAALVDAICLMIEKIGAEHEFLGSCLACNPIHVID